MAQITVPRTFGGTLIIPVSQTVTNIPGTIGVLRQNATATMRSNDPVTATIRQHIIGISRNGSQ